MDSKDTQKRRNKRAEFHRRIKLFLGSDTVLSGVSNDISAQSASFFVSLKGAASFFSEGGKKGDYLKMKFSRIREKLVNQTVLLAVDDGDIGGEPISLSVLRVEPSWKKGYEIFLGGRFLGDNAFLRKRLEKLCPSLVPGAAGKWEKYVSESLQGFRQDMLRDRASAFKFEYTNKYAHVQLFRDLVTKTAALYDFKDMELYRIKLLADELLTNAFLYGSMEPGRDCTALTIMLLPGRFLMTVRDFGGRLFNDYPYHVRKTVKGSEGGLSLVEAYSDDWQVETMPKEHTDVSFYLTSKSGG